jgi:hypothetical protein
VIECQRANASAHVNKTAATVKKNVTSSLGGEVI